MTSSPAPAARLARPLIELREVEKYYGDYYALRKITTDIREGEFFSLLGPSGCGKTTLLRCIAGFEEISGGHLSIDGKDMEDVPANKRPTNMVFQSYAIFPHLTVEENVGFGLRRDPSSKEDKARRVAEALEMVGLKGFGKRAAHALSGGQRQRVALARALILKPRVLLLDEPLSALDKKMREQMQSELRKLQRQVGITFILVTHDQEEALIMSDRIAVMFEGEIAQLDSPERLYRRPISRKVAEFIGIMNFLPARVLSTGPQIALDVAGLGQIAIDAEQCPGTPRTGDASVGFRPETMTVLYEGDPEPSRGKVAQGTVEEVVYFGDMSYYEVRLEGVEKPVQISMRNVVGRPVLLRGSRTRIAWEAGALVLFCEPKA